MDVKDLFAQMRVGEQINKDKRFLKDLNIGTRSSVNEVKSAYRKKIMDIHPDKNPSTTGEFQRLTSMYNDYIGHNTEDPVIELLENTKCDCGLTQDSAINIGDERECLICEDCGFIFSEQNISTSAEWNCYRNSMGVVDKTNIRCGVNRDVENPYDKGLPQAYPTGWKQTFVDHKGIKRTVCMDRVNMWHIPYKQKAFWEVSQQFDSAIQRLGTTVSKVSIAKKLWHHVMESGKVSRGANRRGLIANCLIYACKLEGDRVGINDVASAFQIDSSEITRGHKIFKEIMTGSQYEYIMYDKLEDTRGLFVRHISVLKLKFKITIRCAEIYDQYSKIMSNVAPQSRIAGIIAWVVHVENNLKKPNKSQICNQVGVCNPTLKKVVEILRSLI